MRNQHVICLTFTKRTHEQSSVMNASIQKCFRGGEKPVKASYSIQEYGNANSEIKGLTVHREICIQEER